MIAKSWYDSKKSVKIAPSASAKLNFFKVWNRKISMVKEKFMAFFQNIREKLKNDLSFTVCALVILVVIVATFALQNKIVGFEPGYDLLQPKHHGWVSSQGLAIMTTATLENHFVGYAVALKDANNNNLYDYFDRYPVFFSASFNRLLSLFSKLSDKVYAAKQGMNLIFLATLIMAFLIIDKLIGNKPLALTAVLLTFSNPFLLFYKDMIHFDQPALFGCLLLIYSIAVYKLDGKKTLLIISTFVAIALGRGYASYPILMLWVAFEAFLILKSRDFDLKTKLTAILKQPALILLVLGIIWGAGLLSYNIVMEAQKRDISIMQTSIIDSAQRRLSLNPEFNQANEGIINWQDFTVSEVNRIIQWSFPYNKVNLDFFGNSILLIMMLIMIGRFIQKQTTEKRLLFLLVVLFGFGWLIPLRNLAAFHDYTTMYYVGIPLVFFLALLTLLKPSKKTAYSLLMLGLLVYVSAIFQVKHLHETIAGNANQYTYDFMQIDQKIDGKGHNIFLKNTVPYAPYVPVFYLPDQYISPIELADYVISENRNYGPDNLTPQNHIMFLFKNVKK